jgi:hypothetical protein
MTRSTIKRVVQDLRRIRRNQRKKRRDDPGRLPRDWTLRNDNNHVRRDWAAISTDKQRESCNVLIMNIDDEEEWHAKRVLKEYKQQMTVEQSIPVLKDTKSVATVFLKNEQRIEALR